MIGWEPDPERNGRRRHRPSAHDYRHALMTRTPFGSVLRLLQLAAHRLSVGVQTIVLLLLNLDVVALSVPRSMTRDGK
jgi:hypothetical protein